MKHKKLILWSVSLILITAGAFGAYKYADRMYRAYSNTPLTIDVIIEHLIRWKALKVLIDENGKTVLNESKAARSESIDYVFMKATEGESFKDRRFKGRWRKGFETYYTVLVELLWSKERIMEVYLNIAETGKGILGVEAAAQKYFDRSAAKLNTHQAVCISCVLPNPLIRNPKTVPQKNRSEYNKLIRVLNRHYIRSNSRFINNY